MAALVKLWRSIGKVTGRQLWAECAGRGLPHARPVARGGRSTRGALFYRCRDSNDWLFRRKATASKVGSAIDRTLAEDRERALSAHPHPASDARRSRGRGCKALGGYQVDGRRGLGFGNGLKRVRRLAQDVEG